jgi:hypothetical protein
MSDFGSGPVQPGVDTSPVVPPAGTSGWIIHLIHLTVGAVAAGLAFNADFAAGKATFASDAWRVAFGAGSAVFAFLALRGLVRVTGDKSFTLTPELRRRARRRGAAIGLFGAWLFASATLDLIAEETVAFESWAEPFFLVGGLLLVAQGLSFQLDLTRGLRRRQLRSGPTVPGTARILGLKEIATTGDATPVVDVQLEIEVNGRVYTANDRIALPSAAVAVLAPGSTVDVVVDLVDPHVFEVDWNSGRGPDDRPLPLRKAEQ